MEKKTGKILASYGTCRDCGENETVTTNDWYHIAKPRCSACGGVLDRGGIAKREGGTVRQKP